VIEIVIDGRTLSVERGITILEAAESADIPIPTLCCHPGLSPDGNCRLCSVEIEQRGRRRLVASCMFPIQGAGLSVFTDTERVRKARRFVLQLLVNRNPKAPILRTLAAEYGVTREERFASEPDLCIRCGRCVRACERDGTNAISLVRRGFEKRVSAPFDEPAAACVGCLACAEVCPTGKITYREEKGTRIIWDRTFEMIACERCGARFATREQLAWAGASEEDARLCERCRRAEFVGRFEFAHRG
jgi:NADH dehydrogenase/NADH:ubiquinone oxidoreductase subunit G